MLNVWSSTHWFVTSNYLLQQESEVKNIMGLRSAVFEYVEVKKSIPTIITKESCSSSMAKHNMGINKLKYISTSKGNQGTTRGKEKVF